MNICRGPCCSMPFPILDPIFQFLEEVWQEKLLSRGLSELAPLAATSQTELRWFDFWSPVLLLGSRAMPRPPHLWPDLWHPLTCTCLSLKLILNSCLCRKPEIFFFLSLCWALSTFVASKWIFLVPLNLFFSYKHLVCFTVSPCWLSAVSTVLCSYCWWKCISCTAAS